MDTHHYSTRIVRVTASLVVAIFITLRDRWHQIGDALINPAFYAALSVSFCIAYGILYFVHIANAGLDKKFPLHQYKFRRVLLQIVIGILVPALMDLILMFFYFKIIGREFPLTYFFVRDLQFAVLFLGLLNGNYLLFSSSRKKANQIPTDLLIIKHNGVDITVNASTEVLYIYKDGRNIKIMTISGLEFSKRETISSFKRIYGQLGFCQVNPSAMVNINMLKGYITGSRSKTLEVLFKMQYHDKISRQKLEKLRVTREYRNSFKEDIKNFVAV